MTSSEHRVVLTGTSGTLGYHILDQLAAEPRTRIRALLRAHSRIHNAPSAMVEYQRVDFSDKLALAKLLDGFDPTCLIHCAATGMHFPKPEWFDLIRFNVDLSIDLCECVSRIPGCHLIYISTGLAYRDQGRPLREDDPLDTLHPYGASKAAADVLVRSAAAEFRVPLTVLRPFSFTGVGDDRSRLFPSLLRAAVEDQPLDMSPGRQARDHCAAQDIATGVVTALRSHQRGEADARIFNLGSGDPSSLHDLVERVADELGLNVRLNFGAKDYARFEPMVLVADLAHARQALDWQPRYNLSYAVWQLARQSFPSLPLKIPRQLLS